MLWHYNIMNTLFLWQSVYRIVGFFEVCKFHEFRGWDRFMKFKSSKNFYRNIRILNNMAACIPSMGLAT